MSVPMRVLSLSTAAFLLGGCIAPISVSHYETAEPVGRGNFQVSGGMHAVGKDGRYGLDAPQTDGSPVTTHMRGAVLLPDAQLTYGVTNRADLHVQAFPYGGEIGARVVLVDAPKVKVAAGGAFGGFTGSRNSKFTDDTNGDGINDYVAETRRNYSGYYADVPLTISLIPTDAIAFNAGPVLTWVEAEKVFAHTEQGLLTQSYTVRHRAWELGFFAGASVGSPVVRVSPGVTFYLEHSDYPIENFSGDGWYAMPWIGLTVNPGARQR